MLMQPKYPLPQSGGGGGGGGLTITISPVGPIVAYNPSPGASFNSPNRTVHVSGGTGPYTFLWDAGDGVITTNSRHSATTNWHYTGHPPASHDEIYCTCIVTDSVGNSGYISVDVYMQAGGAPP